MTANDSTGTTTGAGPLLAVDDSEDDLFILRRCFERSTLVDVCRMDCFQSGTDFLAHMDRVSSGDEPFPAMVLLDINMPMMDGFEVLAALRARDEFVRLPAVVFVSTSDRLYEAERAEHFGAAFQEKFHDVTSGVAFFDALGPKISR
jgi:CheY-like chemotaxis protein